MPVDDENTEYTADANQDFFQKMERSFRALFEAAKARNELHFVLSLNSEFRGEQGPGWSTADDAQIAFHEYIEFVNESPQTSLKARVALGFYCHLSEASGFYEIPKNMLRVAEGEEYNLWPFRNLVERHKVSGNIIAPNANKVLKDLAGHASELGMQELAEVFRDAFDSDLRNGYAHADYIIWSDGIRLRKRNGGYPKIVTWEEFNVIFGRGINFFHFIAELVQEYKSSYNPPKKIRGRLSNSPEMFWTIHADPERGAFSISSSLT